MDLGSLADWVGAIATTAAVIAALCLARRSDRERITVAFNLGDDALDVYVVNPTDLPIMVRDVRLSLGRWRPTERDDIEVLLTQVQRLPAKLAPRADMTLPIAITYAPSYLPQRLHDGWSKRSRLDRGVYVVVISGSRAKYRTRVPRKIVSTMLARWRQAAGK